MKQTTKEWLSAAEDDLLAAQKLAGEPRLTNVVSFHCQQCLEKCFKAIIEESGERSVKSHDLLRLQLNAEIHLSESETNLIGIINEVYIDARYPGDLGLLPQGKPTLKEVETFIKFCENLFSRIKFQLSE
jgi:HEPN domain-containing protein